MPARTVDEVLFARELTKARHAAELSVREVARRAGIPASTAGDYFAGRHLPSITQPETFDAVLAACGISEPTKVRRWHERLNRAHEARETRPGWRALPQRDLGAPGTTAALRELTRQRLRLSRTRPGVTCAPARPRRSPQPNSWKRCVTSGSGPTPRHSGRWSACVTAWRQRRQYATP